MTTTLSFVRPKNWLSSMVIVALLAAYLPVKVWASGGYPYADYNGPGTSPKEYVWTDTAGRRYSPYGYVFRNCTDFAAWKMVNLGVPSKTMAGLGHATNWAESARKRGIRVSAEPHPWTVAISTATFYGHVAVVEEVRADGVIKIQEYNIVPGTYGERFGTPQQLGLSEFVHFGAQPTNNQSALVAKNESVAIVKSYGVGGEAQVYVASRQKVYESWWLPGGDGVRTNTLLAPGDVQDIDKLTLPDGTQSLYTAVNDGIWESWWRPGSGLHSAKIISLERTKKVVALMQGNTHLLYVLAADGPYEYWWRDGGDGIHKTRLAHIPDALDFVKTTGQDGAQQVYTATAGAVFETWWYPSQDVHTTAVVSIPQNNIVTIHKMASGRGAVQYLYTATTNGIWESWWQPGAGIGNARIITKDGVRRMEKHVQPDGTHQLYVATKGEVFEYWWVPWKELRSGQLFTGADIADIHKTTQGNFQQLYAVDGGGGYETWWGNGRLNRVKLQGIN